MKVARESELAAFHDLADCPLDKVLISMCILARLQGCHFPLPWQPSTLATFHWQPSTLALACFFQMEDRLSKGEQIDLDLFTRSAGHLRRILEALDLRDVTDAHAEQIDHVLEFREAAS